MQQSHLIIGSLVLVFLAVGVGIGISFNGGTSPVVNSTSEEISFIASPPGHVNVYLWGLRNSNLSSPIELNLAETESDAKDAFIRGEVSLADLKAIHAAEALAKDPDAKILPYKVNAEKGFSLIHTWENSSIDSPEDLDGKTVEVVGFSKVPQNTNILLKKVYDAEVNWTFRNGSIEDTKDSLRKENVDAIFLVGDKRLKEEGIDGLKSVYSPTETMNRKFGDSGLPRFFIVKNDPEAIETSFRAIERFQESASNAKEHPKEFKNNYYYCKEFLIERSDKKQVEEMSPQFVEQMQYFLNAAYDQGVIDQKINVSERVVRRNPTE